jgi:hypothetical protein
MWTRTASSDAPGPGPAGQACGRGRTQAGGKAAAVPGPVARRGKCISDRRRHAGRNNHDDDSDHDSEPATESGPLTP